MKKSFIRKAAVVAIACLTTTSLLTGCGSKKDPYKSEEYNVDDYVVLGTYTGLSADEAVKIVTDEDVKQELDNLIQENVTYTDITNRAAKLTDKVTINYTKSVTGKKDETKSDYVLELGSGDMGEDFENKLVGLAINGELTFTVDELVNSSEDETQESEASEETTEAKEETVSATYKVKLTKIQEKVTPELTDAFIKDKTESDSIEAYKTDKKKELEENNAKEANDSAKSSLLSQVVDSSTVDGAPTFLYNINYNSVAKSYASYAVYFGMDLKGYLEACGSSMDKLKLDAVGSTKECLVVEALVKKLNIDVTDEEFDKNVDSYVTEYQWSSKEELLKNLSKDQLLIEMRKEKALDYLYSNSTINKSSVSGNEE